MLHDGADMLNGITGDTKLAAQLLGRPGRLVMTLVGGYLRHQFRHGNGCLPRGPTVRLHLLSLFPAVVAAAAVY